MTLTERERVAQTFTCPRCGAQPGMPCTTSVVKPPIQIPHPHKERTDLVTDDTAQAGQTLREEALAAFGEVSPAERLMLGSVYDAIVNLPLAED